MSRQPRIAGEYLHIIVRGIGKQILFEEQSDNEKYLEYKKIKDDLITKDKIYEMNDNIESRSFLSNDFCSPVDRFLKLTMPPKRSAWMERVSS